MEKKAFIIRNAAKIGDGERRELTFLANSGNPMADGYTVDLETLWVRDPDTNEQTLVKSLDKETRKNFVPLLVDHNWSVESKVGQVRGLWLTDEGLVACATVAQTVKGDDILTLAKDDMLDTYSITVGYSEQPGKDAVIHNAQLLEISTVWLGNDETTKLLSVNQAKEENMQTSEVKANELTADEAAKLQSQIDQLTATVKGLTKDDDDDADKGDDKGADAPAPATDANAADKVAENARVVKNARPAVVQSVNSKANSWLATPEADHAFAQALINNRTENAMTAFGRIAKMNGVTGDAVLPSSVENVLFKAWSDSDNLLSTFRTSTNKRMTLHAAVANGDSGRAHGHTKGAQKVDQDLNIVNRNVAVRAIYKKLPLDLQDLVDDTDGSLLKFRAEELASRVSDEIARGALIGDGRGSAANGVFVDGRGLHAIATDIAGSDAYAKSVATEVKVAPTETLYVKVHKALARVKGAKKVVVLPEGGIEELMLATNANGMPLLAVGTTPEIAFPNVKFFEAEWMNGAAYDVIAYADQSYVVIGDGQQRVITDFDLNTNRDLMLVERYVGGSLYGYHVAAGVKTAASAGASH